MISVIEWKTRDPLYGMDSDGLKARLKELLADRVREAWIFGSFAKGGFGTDSDIDLIVVADTDLPFTRRQSLFDDLYSLVPALDLLVYTPAEFARLTADPSPGFWQDVSATMRRLL